MEENDMNRAMQTIVAVCFLVLAGCGSSPAVHYYTLETINSRVTQDAAGSPIMAVGAFRLPEYLNRSQMVSRGAGAEMIVDDVNRWAEPLDASLHRVLASNLDVLLESMVVIAYPGVAAVDVEYRLIGRIDRFTPDANGLVVLDVQWAVTDSAGTIRLPPRRASFESQAARPGDAGARAQAMSDVLAQFSRDIAGEVDRVGLD